MIRNLLLLIALSVHSVCSVPGSGRIVGGAEVSIEAYPWQVSIQHNGTHYCGGAIYSSNVIVTAAQCLQTVAGDLNNLKVRAGSRDWRQGGILCGVASIRIHEGYNARTMDNDVALLCLVQRLTFGPTIRNIGLPERAPAQGAPADVSGWGKQYFEAQTKPAFLRAVALNVVREAECKSAYGYGSEAIKNSMICAAAANRDACEGDTGGPLVSGGALVGIVSWGFGCAMPNFPGVYACVFYARNWIAKNAEEIQTF